MNEPLNESSVNAVHLTFLRQIGKQPFALCAPELVAELPTALQQLCTDDAASRLIGCLWRYSPFLRQLVLKNEKAFLEMLASTPEAYCQQRLLAFADEARLWQSTQDAMRDLRRCRQHMALCTALADIAGYWPVEAVTFHLSRFADVAIEEAMRFLLQEAIRKNEITPRENLLSESGLLLLAMGKYGAYELNYSSDIDIVILFDAERIGYIGRHTPQHFATQIAQNLASLLQDRTADGYCFRVDLRLRPDPRSTPPAVNINSAITYYETVGQNWERAAMIKSRAIASDVLLASRFERAMSAYIWRRHLDFATIADINSIKRQMSIKIGDQMELPGHNVKLGRGGIREIEFFAQTKQLIWGGRHPQLRTRQTIEALTKLVEIGQLDESIASDLSDSYHFLRLLEHRLQMIADQQTHSIPETHEEIAVLAGFMGYENSAAFEEMTLMHLTRVHRHYVESMEHSPSLSAEGNLVFTGVEADPETLKTLSEMGYQNPVAVSDLIQSWHRGSRRATKTLVARQILTEIIPQILRALADTLQPDAAFMRFDDFIARLPSGVQIFSLLQANPELMGLLATIMGTAPALGETLSKQPALLDAVLDEQFFDALPDKEPLSAELQARLSLARDYEDALRVLRSFKHEREFQAGIQLLKQQTDLLSVGSYLSALADCLCAATLSLTAQEFARNHGHVAGASYAILGFGKLGTQELTFGSDLDLVFIYQLASDECESNGNKPLDGNIYFQRLASRVMHSFTLLTKEGALYEVDGRLRPGGNDGPLATRLDRFLHYYTSDSWMIERMSLIKARIISASDDHFARQIYQEINQLLHHNPEKTALFEHLQQMRQKIFNHHRTQNVWQVKHRPGGLMDLDFLAQALCLLSPHCMESSMLRATDILYAALGQAGILDETHISPLIESYQLQRDVLSILRLCSQSAQIDHTSPTALKKLLASLTHYPDIDALEAALGRLQQLSSEIIDATLAAQ